MNKRFRKCGSCFRYAENWRDAQAKGFEPRDAIGFAMICKKPRKGVGVICTDVDIKKIPKAKDNGCEYHKYRWTWNLEMWWRWIFTYNLKRLFCQFIRCPIGGLRKPVALSWEDDYDVMHDRIVKNAVPICPHCGEMPYSYKQCVFCGQRFLQDEKTEAAKNGE